jgi:hypothetical protein
MAGPGELRGRLAGTWYRSFEEEHGEDLVFRPPSYTFPAARAPRPALRLSDDGTAAALVAGPDDRARGETGSWTLDGVTLGVRTPQLTGDFLVQDVEADRLVVRPAEQP